MAETASPLLSPAHPIPLSPVASNTPLLLFTAPKPLLSLANIIKTYENWLHFGTFVHEPLKESLRNVLHNNSFDSSYQGLPIDPVALYQELNQKHRPILDKLLRKGVLQNDQMLLIFPPNCKETHSDKFDITLIVVLIINCTELRPPATGWKNKHPPINDQSKAANVIRARELRNIFHHKEPKDFDEQTFNAKWKEGEDIITALDYTYDTQTLKSACLDPTRLSVINSLVEYLQIEQNALKKTVDSINAEDTKSSIEEIKKQIVSVNIEDIKSNVEGIKKNTMEQLKHVEMLEEDLVGALKHIQSLKEESNVLKDHIISLQHDRIAPGM